MSATFLLVFSVAFAAFLVLLHLALNRGKFDLKGFSLLMGYSLLTGLTSAYAVMFAGAIDLVVYGIVATIIAGPFAVLESINLAKGRGSPFRSIAGILGILCMMSTPLFGKSLFWLPELAGFVGIGTYLWFHFRSPPLNPMWLNAEMEEAARIVPHGCGYSSKPITVFMQNKRSFFCGTFGCGIYVRRDRTVFWLKRRAHERLGRPNLELLAREIARRIGEGAGEKETTK